MRPGDLYYEEITTATYRELVRVGAWFNRVVGYHPVLVGGWAVFHYNPAGLGSRDIDLIFPDRAVKDRLVNLYLLTHGYERETPSAFEETYALVVRTARAEERVYLDAATVHDANRVHGEDVEVPWRLAFDHQRPARLGDADFYVPSPEVLLLLKAKAALDREYDARRAFDPFYLQQKAWKDHYDVASLLKACEFDARLLRRLLRDHGFGAHLRRVVEALAGNRSVLERHGVSGADLRRKIEDALR